LKKLADFKLHYENPLFTIKNPESEKGLGCEFWIGSHSEKPRVLSLAFKNIDFCDVKFWESVE